MEPNAREIFSHTDADGDRLRIITSGPERLTVSVGRSMNSHLAHLSRDGAAVLRDALIKWLEDPEEAAEEATEPEAWTDAEAQHRPEALRLAVQLAKQNATESAVFSLADQMAHWLATGERMPVAAPVATPPLLTFVDAAPPALEDAPGMAVCGVCSHPFHGVAVCADGAPGTAHVDRCQCRGGRR